MTLKEKFFDLLTNPKGMTRLDVVDKNVEITDEFAIGFGEFCLKIKFEPIENVCVKKLLKIYKKENEL